MNEMFVGLFSFEWVRDLNAIADRIEAEYAAYRAAADTKLKEYVKLPVDADGVPIHVGDELTNGEDLPAKVRGMMLDEDGWAVSSASFGVGRRVDPSTLRHVQPDSWEGIISDAVILGRQLEWLDNSRGDADSERELVERCRRLAGADASAAWNVRTEDDGLQQG